MRDQLKDHIKAMLEGIKHLSVDDAADLLAEIGDEIAGDRTDDLFHGAILDGLRWGYHAAVVVEMGGGAMLRACLPGGVAITHEWADDADAQPQIKAALAAVQDGRATAQNVGDEDE
jgi:hypothetical protein